MLSFSKLLPSRKVVQDDKNDEPKDDSALLMAAEDIRAALKTDGEEGNRQLMEALKSFFTLVDEDVEEPGDDLQDQY